MRAPALRPRLAPVAARRLARPAAPLLALLLVACATAPVPPVAERRPHVVELHGAPWSDDWFWLRHREDPAVIAHLEAENRYTEAMMAHTKGLQKTLFDEMLARIQEDDASVPYKEGDWYYYSRTESGKPYAIHCRKRGSLDAPEEIVLDENALAAGKSYLRVGIRQPSPDGRWLVYSTDELGNERYVLRVRDLSSGRDLPETIPDTYYSVAWSADGRHVFYTTVDHATRPSRVLRHEVGTATTADVLVHDEPDEAFFVGIGRARSGRFIFIEIESAVTTELRVVDAAAPTEPARILAARRPGVEYDVDHQGEQFLLRTNDGAVNFKLVAAPIDDPRPERWTELVPHREDVYLVGLDAFRDHLVLYERERGLPQIRVRRVADGAEHRVAFDEASYEVWPESNVEYATTTLRFVYESPITPSSTWDYELDAKTRTLLKRQPVPGYDPAPYVVERLEATAKDGTKVPITVVRKKATALDGTAPMLLEGYGSYGLPYDAGFVSSAFSLVDRGFVVGIAHIRGGGEMGRRWKDDGKFEKKVNSFTDFIACAEHLIAARYTSPSRLAIAGGSAGGLLMGAVINMRPDLFRATIARVPFVDVVNTMLDASIPLTVTEWEEWGNPNERHFFDVMKAYSPYDNVKAQAYPNLLVIAGLNDPRVQYWEPAKWTAKLRATKTGDAWLLLKTDMGAGHGGNSGRYGKLEDRAFQYAFLLDRLGVAP
jgi:oligopeptidase B